MKNILFAIFMGMITVPVFAQEDIADPAHWIFSAKKLDAVTYEVHIKVAIDKGWHIYAQVQPKEAIALPTKIVFSKGPLITVVGKTKEIGKRETYINDVIGTKQYHYSGSVEFVQVVKLKVKVKTNINGQVNYMVCTDKKCLPETARKFSVVLD